MVPPVPGAEEGSYDGREDEASCEVKQMWAVTYPLWMEVDACGRGGDLPDRRQQTGERAAETSVVACLPYSEGLEIFVS